MSDALAELQAIYEALPSVECKRLCQGCCTQIPFTPLEESRMKAWRGKLPRGVTRRLVDDETGIPTAFSRGFEERGPCPLLRHGGCTVHQMRPVVCRLWGVTEAARCPHGCEVTPRPLTPEETEEVLRRVAELS